MKKLYCYVVGPHDGPCLEISIASVRKFDPEAKIALLLRPGTRLNPQDVDVRVPIPDTALAALHDALEVAWGNRGPGLIVCLSPCVLVRNPAKASRRSVHAAALGNNDISPLYYTFKSSLIPKLRDRILPEAALPEVLKDEGLKMEIGAWDGTFLNRFSTDPRLPLAKYANNRAIAFAGVERERAMREVFAALTESREVNWDAIFPPVPAVEPIVAAPDPDQRKSSLVSLVIVAHEPYLKFLPDLLPRFDAMQTQPDRKILVLDRCDYTPPLGWRVIKGEFRHPSPARQAGLAEVRTPWCYFWDADNLPSLELIEHADRKAAQASPETGLIYAGTQTYDDPRECFFIDTGSCWRVAAIRHAGGWPHTWLEDWRLANILHAQGWKLQPLGVNLPRRKHEEQRSKTQTLANKLWDCRPLGIISLQRGDVDLLQRWDNSLSSQDLPAQCGLTVVDDSGSESFALLLDAVLARHAERFERITVLRSRREGITGRQFAALHGHVGGLYAKAIAATPEQVILTWEDDVTPRDSRALYQLAAILRPGFPPRRIAAVAGVYQSRHYPTCVVASPLVERWSGLPTNAVRPGEQKMGMIGGGFTLWSRAALEQCPILGADETDQARGRLGWDGFLCQRLTRSGWNLFLHGDVWCDHDLRTGLTPTNAHGPGHVS